MITHPSVPGSVPERIGQGLALVDYDNVRRRENDSKADVELDTVDLVDTVASAFREAFPGLKELDVRFYGGWIDEFGFPSPAAFQLLPVLTVIRGRRSGLIVRPSLAVTMVQFPDMVLRGTVRLGARPKRQKMVDGMLGCDAIAVAAAGLAQVGLVTDDDDLIPAALSAYAVSTKPIAWIRRRSNGTGLNDRNLTARGLQIHNLEDDIYDRRA